MVYHGRVKNGVIVFDDNLALPDGARVTIERVTESATSPTTPSTVADRYRAFIGTADDLPEDFAASHDQYIHRPTTDGE